VGTVSHGALNAAEAQGLGDPTVQSRLVEFGQELFPRERQTPEAGLFVPLHDFFV
jgi:hypothetical protein